MNTETALWTTALVLAVALTSCSGSYRDCVQAANRKNDARAIVVATNNCKSLHRADYDRMTLLSRQELRSFEGSSLRLQSHGWWEAVIHNGSNRRVGWVNISVSVMDESTGETLPGFPRRYELSSTEGHPNSSSKFIGEAGLRLGKGQKIEKWSIVGARTEM